MDGTPEPQEITRDQATKAWEEAKTWVDTHKDESGKSTIYNPDLAVKDSEGKIISPGLIADANTAHELAEIEEQQGRNTASARESELQRQAESGLKTNERIYMEIIEGLKKDYPNALVSHIDEQGKEYYVLYPVERGGTGADWINVISQAGCFWVDIRVLGGATNYNKVAWGEVFSKISTLRGDDDSFCTNIDSNIIIDDKIVPKETDRANLRPEDYIRIEEVNLGKSSNQDTYRMQLEKGEERGIRAKRSGNNESNNSSKAILAALARK